MLNILPGSPAKLERVERHLIRQRGAGVRNLATSFGFSLGLSNAPIDVSDHLEEPHAKRRKSNHTTTGKRALEETLVQPEKSAAKIKPKPKVRRRCRAVVEEAALIARDDGNGSFSTTAKKGGRPKKTDVHVEAEDHDVPVTAKVPARRPRRNAAVSALAKVTEGFAEEARSIDKKRREPEPERPARKGPRKAAPVVATEAELIITNTEARHPGLEECIIVPQKQEIQHVEIVKKKTAARNRKGNLKAVESAIKRLPLEETHVNIPSKSPEKGAKTTHKNAAACHSLTSPMRQAKANVTTKHSSQQFSEDYQTSGTTKSATLVAVTDSSLEGRYREEKSTNQIERCNEASGYNRSPAKVKQRCNVATSRIWKAARVGELFPVQDRENDAEKAEASCSPTPPVAPMKMQVPPSTDPPKVDTPGPSRAGSDRQPKDRRKDATKPKSQKASSGDGKVQKRSTPPIQNVLHQSKCADTTKAKVRIETAVSSTDTREEADLDWLFETNEKRKAPPRQGKRKASVNGVRRAQSPEVDLDDMLSNIASWAPKER